MPEEENKEESSQKEQDQLLSSYKKIDKEVDRKIWISHFIPSAKQGFFLTLATLEIFIIIGGLFYLGYYLTFDLLRERDQLSSMVVNIDTQNQVTIQNLAQPMIVGEARTYPSPGDRTDYIALLENTNDRWLAEFQYFFNTPDGNTTPRRGYLLPGRSFYATELGSETVTNARTVEIVIDNLEWFRISPANIPDLTDWLDFREDIIIENIRHGDTISIADTNIIQTSFDIQNATPFSYWDVDILVILSQANNISAINRIRLPGLDTGESRTVNVNWFGNISRTGSISVIPQLNFFNPQIYRENPIDSVQDIRNNF